MPQPKSLLEREQAKFIESPTRPNKSAVEVIIGNPEDVGSAGTVNTTPEITNFEMPVAGDEYEFTLPANCKCFKVKPQLICRLWIAYVSGGPYFYVGLGSGFSDSNKYLSQKIYLKSDKVNLITDIITYK